jgi:hypothetical protein
VHTFPGFPLVQGHVICTKQPSGYWHLMLLKMPILVLIQIINCDAHLINEGISVTDSSGVIMFEVTGPTAASPVTNFNCTVTNSVVSGQMSVLCKCMYVVTTATLYGPTCGHVH